MSVFNVHGFRYDVMLGIYEDYDILLIREQFSFTFVTSLILYCCCCCWRRPSPMLHNTA